MMDMFMQKKAIAASWSGGKDCCLALYRSMKQGFDVKYLLNLVSEDGGRCCFHGVEAGLLKLQAGLMGIPLVQKPARDDMTDYEKDFKDGVGTLEGIQGMVFGDIYLDEHRDWVERVCADMGIEALEPLWNEEPSRIAEEFVDAGFEAIVVSCQAYRLGSDFLGRKIDREMIRELVARGICPCGENGEFHTLVIGGPVFKRRIRVVEAEKVLRDGFWKHWSLDIKKYE